MFRQTEKIDAFDASNVGVREDGVRIFEDPWGNFDVDFYAVNPIEDLLKHPDKAFHSNLYGKYEGRFLPFLYDAKKWGFSLHKIQKSLRFSYSSRDLNLTIEETSCVLRHAWNFESYYARQKDNTLIGTSLHVSRFVDSGLFGSLNPQVYEDIGLRKWNKKVPLIWRFREGQPLGYYSPCVGSPMRKGEDWINAAQITHFLRTGKVLYPGSDLEKFIDQHPIYKKHNLYIAKLWLTK